MKTVKVEFEIPDWANYIAKDADGSIYVFERKPEPDLLRAYWDSKGRSHRIIQLKDDVDWKNTLKEV